MNLPKLLRLTRQYFWNLDFDEVQVPYLNESLPLEPNIYSFKTVWTHSKVDYYLPTSPEFALKKHILESKHNCFSICHCFRDLEDSSPTHTPEFLMLEWYEVGKDFRQLMSSVETYLRHLDPIKFKNAFPIITLPTNLPKNEPEFNQFFLNEIEPKLPTEPVFVIGYPPFLSPLAHSVNGVAHRFELYINHIEIANGCTENIDSVSIQKAFQDESVYRNSNLLPTHPFSQDFVNQLKNIPPCAGVGLGLERLSMVLST